MLRRAAGASRAKVRDDAGGCRWHPRIPGQLRLRLRAALAVVLLLAAPALALDQPLPDPDQEARALALHRELRCLVCQNQSIAESNAALAEDLRQIVRERIAAGDSDRQVLEYVRARYGDWVLLDPPFKLQTWALWLGPALLLVLAGLGVRLWLVRQAGRSEAAPAPLSPAEEARLAALLERDAER